MRVGRLAWMLTACAGLAACAPPPGAPAAAGRGAHAASASACRLSLAAVVPITLAEHDSKLLVPVTMDGTGLTMILDTGSQSILLTHAAAERAGREIGTGTLIGGLDESSGGFAQGVGGSRYVTKTQIDDLAIGRIHGTFGAQVTDDIFPAGSLHTDGLLGMSVLANFDLDLNLAAHELRLYSTAGDCDAPAVALDQPVYSVKLLGGFRSETRPMVPVTINGQPFRAVLDSGAPGIALFRHTGAALGLTPGQGRALVDYGIGGATSATEYQVDRVSVGPLTLRHVHVRVLGDDSGQADLLLGLSFMKRVHVWLSNSSGSLAMQYPPAPSPVIGAPGGAGAQTP